MPSKLRLDDLDAEIDNKWMHFRKTHELDASGTQLTVSMTYETKVDEVAAQDLAAFRRAVLQIEDAASFYIENTPRAVSAKLNINAASDAESTVLAVNCSGFVQPPEYQKQTQPRHQG